MFLSLKHVTYHVTDLNKAREWYTQVLGREPVFNAPFAVIFTVGECGLMLVPSAGPAPQPDDWAVVSWEVDDIEAAYQRLLALGATTRAEIITRNDVQHARVADPFGNVLGLMSRPADAQKLSVQNQPSESAFNVAICRAMAAHEDGDDVRGPDTLAEIFLNEDSRKAVIDRASREHIKTMVTPPLYHFLHARTVWLDGVFTRALTDGFSQIVFLGAGYDSRAYRFRDRLGGTRVFELDAPATQQRKRRQLELAGIPVPERVTFAETDFKEGALDDVLRRAGFNSRARTLFIWEGVTYYLPEATARATLDFVGTHSASGSLLCFDYMSKERKTHYTGEPFLFFLAEDRVEPFLREHGFTLLEHSAGDDIARRYSLLPDGRSTGPTLPDTNFVVAEHAHNVS
ncbi:MAG TPA: SAM-dependent methyltransferase [bacterium]|jgi:methyltransferase (TIGR00027 family)